MKIFSLFLLILLISSGLLAQTAIAPSIGDGNSGNPYQIASLGNLYWIAAGDDVVPVPDQLVRWSSHYIQTADIDASSTTTWFQNRGWNTIGYFVSPTNFKYFTGSYDGQDYTIDALFISRSTTGFIGLFGITEGAVIENLGLTNVNITGRNIVGALAGQLTGNSLINNCYSTGSVSGVLTFTGGLVGINTNSIIDNCYSITSVNSPSNYVGGLVGSNTNATISNSYTSGDVVGLEFAGGLVGRNNDSALIINSYSTGTITGIGKIGGLVGLNDNYATINNCYSSGFVDIGDPSGCPSCGISNAGGLLGLNANNSLVTNSYSSVNIFGRGRVGGLVGENNSTSTVSNSYSTGIVTSDNLYAGGLVGYNSISLVEYSYSISNVQGTGRVGGLVGISQGPGSSVRNSFSKGNTIGTDRIGGLIGESGISSTIINCYSTGSVVGNTSLGGLVGYFTGTSATNSYWNTETSGLMTSAVGEARTTNEMTYPHASNTYVDWDFVNIWVQDCICMNEGYPYLQWYENVALYPAQNLTAIRYPGLVELTWEEPQSNGLVVLGYNVYRDEIMINTELIIGLSYEDLDVDDDLTYNYFVTVLYDVGESCPSNMITVIPLAGPTAIAPATGDGSSANPYEIATLENLYWITAGNDVVPIPNQTTRWSSYYIQTFDIDASSTSEWFNGQGWNPIGFSFTYNFAGSYDGQDYIINGLYINRPDTDYIGLFGITHGAIIGNLGLTNVNITGQTYVGALVGRCRLSSLLSNCYSEGSINGYTHVGGLIGRHCTSSSIYRSYSKAMVSGNQLVGGLTGQDTGSAFIVNCYAMGNVSGIDKVGGLTGEVSSATVTNSYSTGIVTGATLTGGLTGYVTGATINNSYWNTETSGQATSAGGLGRTTTEMTYPYTVNTFIDWDFENIWEEDPLYVNNGYPYLHWQDFGILLYPPKSPENVGIAIIGSHVVLTWDLVSEDINNQPVDVDYYFIFSNDSGIELDSFSYLDLSYGNQYIHLDAAQQSDYRFYLVKAVVLNEPAAVRNGFKEYAEGFLKENLKSGMTETEVSELLQKLISGFE